MKESVLFASLLMLAGCADSITQSQSSTDPVAGSGISDTGAIRKDDAPGAAQAAFSPGDQSTLEVPEMHCPFACYPKVKETLEGLDGIASVELVKQESDNAINDPRVIVTFDGVVEGKDAVQALEAVSFAGSSFESAD